MLNNSCRIFVRRRMALGDVLCITPVLRRLRSENQSSIIDVATARPAALMNNPDINNIVSWNELGREYDRIIDLDVGYELRPSFHIVDAYSLVTFGDTATPAGIIYVSSEISEKFADNVFGSKGVALHFPRSVPSKCLPQEVIDSICTGILRRGLALYVLGTHIDAAPAKHIRHIDLRDSGSLSDAFAVIKRCSLFVGVDSSLMHLAGASSVPIAAIFTHAAGWRFLPKTASPTVAILAQIACQGCLERRSPPVTDCRCERGDFACALSVSAEAVLDAVGSIVDSQ